MGNCVTNSKSNNKKNSKNILDDLRTEASLQDNNVQIHLGKE